jgi:hypothetical protein
MKLFAIYHRPTQTFSETGSFNVYRNKSLFTPFGRKTKLFSNIGPAKAFITNAAKEARRMKMEDNIEFILALEIIQIEISPLLETPVYSAQFNLDKL